MEHDWVGLRWMSDVMFSRFFIFDLKYSLHLETDDSLLTKEK